MTGYPATWEQRPGNHHRAACSACAVVSHGAAARLFRLDGFDDARPEISVSSASTHHPLVAGRHRGSSNHGPRTCRSVPTRDGLPCTGLGTHARRPRFDGIPDRVWQALISARRLHRVNPLWLQQTALRLHRPGQSGTGVMLAALRRWSTEGTLPDSWFEELLRRMVDHPDIPARPVPIRLVHAAMAGSSPDSISPFQHCGSAWRATVERSTSVRSGRQTTKIATSRCHARLGGALPRLVRTAAAFAGGRDHRRGVPSSGPCAQKCVTPMRISGIGVTQFSRGAR